MLAVVSRAQLTIGTEGQGPIDDADPVVGLRVIGLQLDVLLMVGLGLLKFFGIVGSAGHLEEDGADAVDSAQIVGIDLQNFLEFIDGLGAEAHILLGRSTGNVLAGVSGGQIEAGVHQTRIELFGLLEILDGRVVLAVLVGGDTLIEEIASLQFVAAGEACGEEQERREGRSPPSRSNRRCMSHRSIHPCCARDPKIAGASARIFTSALRGAF